jgi:HD-GYP domain-containing protein (c-di-GMP phosphodiesterase class II)
MRRIAIHNLATNMIVARTVYASDGRILLHEGIALNKDYIKRLGDLGISSIYIRDKFVEDDNIKDVVSEKIRVETIQAIRDNFYELEKGRRLNTKRIHTLVNNLIDELLINSNLLVNLADIRSFDDYTFAHSVNVAILSIMTGITMQYNELQLKELGIGALLHDLGKTKIDVNILNKPDDLNKEEFEEIKRHPQYGFDMLRKHDDISLLSAHIAFQHHERWDGHGYPRQLSGEKILEYARIVAVADVYDALLADRPYRPSYSINQASTIVKRMAGTFLDVNCVDAFLSNIAIFPIGSFLELNTGETGVVVDVNKEMPSRPIVKIIYGKDRHPLFKSHEIDLSKLSTITVKKVLTGQEISLLSNEF